MGVENAISVNVRRFRDARGLSQAAVARGAGISRQAYVDIERGRTKEPRVSNLQAIANVFEVSVIDLMGEVPKLETVRFRTNSMRTNKDKARREQYLIDAAYWLKDFEFLESAVNERREYLLKGVFEQIQGDQIRDPVEVARLTRESLGLKVDEPIGDIVGLMEHAGIKIRTVGFKLDNFFGFSVSEADGGPAIIVNNSKDVTIERRIFTVAHELGHLLLHPWAYDGGQTDEKKEEEREADCLAGHFLMPQNAFQRKLEESYGIGFVERVLFIKRFFGVSYLTVLHRLAGMGVAEYGPLAAKFRSIYKSKHGRSLTGRVEPSALEQSDFVADRLNGLVRRALDNSQITVSRAAEILCIPLREMRELINSWADVAA